MTGRGLYILILKLEKGQTIRIARWGETYFHLGYYLYVGRARRGLRARIKRHLKTDKKTFWHIDYLSKAAQIIEVLVKPGNFNECRLADRLRRTLKNPSLAVPGFGASDCHCPGHLIYLAEKQELESLILTLKQEAGLKDFA